MPKRKMKVQGWNGEEKTVGVYSPPAVQQAWNISWFSLSKVIFCLMQRGSLGAVRPALISPAKNATVGSEQSPNRSHNSSIFFLWRVSNGLDDTDESFFFKNPPVLSKKKERNATRLEAARAANYSQSQKPKQYRRLRAQDTCCTAKKTLSWFVSRLESKRWARFPQGATCHMEPVLITREINKPQSEIWKPFTHLLQ